MKGEQEEQEHLEEKEKTIHHSIMSAFEEHGVKVEAVECQNTEAGKHIWTLVTDTLKGPSAYHYEDGTAIYLDDEGQEIPDLQTEGHRGLEGFLRRYPEGDLYVCDKDKLEKEKVDNPVDYLPPDDLQ